MKFILFVSTLLLVISCTTSRNNRGVAGDPPPPSASLDDANQNNSVWLMARYNISSKILDQLEKKKALRLASGDSFSGNIDIFIDMKNIIALLVSGGLGFRLWRHRDQYMADWNRTRYVFNEYIEENRRRRPGGFYDSQLDILRDRSHGLSKIKERYLYAQDRIPIYGADKPGGRNFSLVAEYGPTHHNSEFDVNMFRGKTLNTGMGPVEILTNISAEKGGPSLYRLAVSGQGKLQALVKEVIENPEAFHFTRVNSPAFRRKVADDLASFLRSGQIKAYGVEHNKKFGRHVSSGTLKLEQNLAKMEKLSVHLQALETRMARRGQPSAGNPRVPILQDAKAQTLIVDINELADEIDNFLVTAKKSSNYRNFLAKANQGNESFKSIQADADDIIAQMNSENHLPSLRNTLRAIGKAAVLPALLTGAGAVITASGWRTFMPISRLDKAIEDQKQNLREISGQLGN